MVDNSLEPVSFSFPLILLAIKPEYDADDCYVFNKQSTFIGGKGKESGEDALLLFTNTVIAKHHARSLNLAYEPVFIDTPDAAIEIATRAKHLHGCTRVAIDPPLRVRRVPAIPVEDFISKLRSLHESN